MNSDLGVLLLLLAIIHLFLLFFPKKFKFKNKLWQSPWKSMVEPLGHILVKAVLYFSKITIETYLFMLNIKDIFFFGFNSL